MTSITTLPSVIKDESPHKIDDAVYELCQSPVSVSTILAHDKSTTPEEAWAELVGDHQCGTTAERDVKTIGKGVLPHEEVRRTRLCGRWGDKEPSDLFIRVSRRALSRRFRLVYTCTSFFLWQTMRGHLSVYFS
jgi:hypothetical protein